MSFRLLSICKCIWLVIIFVFSSFVHSNRIPFGAKSTREIYSTFLNSLHLRVRQLIQRVERIKDRIGKHEMTVLFNQKFKSKNVAGHSLLGGCWIHRLHFGCIRLFSVISKCHEYDTNMSDGEATLMLELWGMRSTLLLPSAPCQLWPRVEASDRVLSMGKKTVWHFNYVLRLNWIFCRGVRSAFLKRGVLGRILICIRWPGYTSRSLESMESSLYCHNIQVHSDLEWQYLLGSHLLKKLVLHRFRFLCLTAYQPSWII